MLPAVLLAKIFTPKPLVNDIDNKPTGSLEDLFRHHLAEAEVPPRPMLWDQIDNSLLVRQNETYRRRLVATRWVAAASLLLATLAGTGWWVQHDANSMLARQPAANGADNSGNLAGMRRTTNGANQQLATNNGAAQMAPGQSASAQNAATTNAGNTTTTSATGLESAANHSEVNNAQLATTNPAIKAGNGRAIGENLVAAGYSQQAAAATKLTRTNRLATETADGFNHSGTSALSRSGSKSAIYSVASLGKNGSRTLRSSSQLAAVPVSKEQNTNGSEIIASAHIQNGRKGLLPSEAATLAATTTAAQPTMATSVTTSANGLSTVELEQMAARMAMLKGLTASPLPTGLATVAVQEPEVIAPVRKWQFGASYAAGVFNPNVNFSRAGIAPEFDYNPALGANSPALSEAAAVEYRQNLKSGVSQRLALRVSRRLPGHWTLSTGLEFAQNEANSATSGYFVGEQVPDLGQAPNGSTTRKTNFRYRTAGLPVELHYANPIRKGWSAYGRVGAVVNALFSTHAEVDGVPEASRTYSLMASNNPYRRLSTNIRGGVGAQFRPTAGSWTLSVGPTAEVGLLSLNAHLVQDFFHQSRAYSVGLEAGIEFGRH